MKLYINRYSIDKDFYTSSYEVSNTNLLQTLFEIKNKIDSSLVFRSSCRSGICGSCAVRVNGVEKLACKTIIKDGDIVEPLKNRAIIKDLVVDVSHETFLIKSAKAFIQETSTKNQEVLNKDIEKMTNCILCNICYSSCPVYESNKEFLGPFALTRALRYINDDKNINPKDTLEAIQTNGIWDCISCSNCTFVCPQHIDSKMDILKLQTISLQNGYENPNMNFENLDFGDDFGFNPNSF